MEISRYFIGILKKGTILVLPLNATVDFYLPHQSPILGKNFSIGIYHYVLAKDEFPPALKTGTIFYFG
jgi:hypothetical protein